MSSLQRLSTFSFERPRTIRFRIVSLVVFVLAPLLVLFAWVAMNFAAAKRDFIELQRLDITNRVSAAIDQEIAGYMGMLTGLAAAGDLRTGDLGRFKEHASILAKRPYVVRIWAFSQNGEVVSRTEASDGAADATSLASDMIALVFRGERAVSTVMGEGHEHATIITAVPVLEKQRVAFGVAAEIKVAPLSQLFAKAGMEESWPAAVVDRNGRFVARSLDAERRVGQPARPELGLAARGASSSGTFENVTYEDVRVLNAFYRSALTGWTTIVAVPEAELTAPLRRAIALILVGGGAILLVTLALAFLLSERISEPVRSLSQFAHALASGQPYRDTTHHIIELDEVRAALEKAIAQSSRLSALVASSGDAIMSIGLDGTIQTWNRGAEDLFGYTVDEIVGKPKTIIVPQERIAEFEAQRTQVLSGGPVRAETVRRKRDGTLVHVSLNSAPIHRPDGTITAISSIIHDISARKVAEEHKTLLMRELAHRSKNQLAIIQSIAGQTARTSLSQDTFLTSFKQRLQGLAASHDLLTSQDWKGASLADIVRQQLEVFADAKRDNVEVSGPEIRITTSAAEAIGLALHELGTNSVKYGALSAPAGRVTVRWVVRENVSKPRQLNLEWIETDGPTVEEPSRNGFGSEVIEHLVAAAVDGKAEIQYRPEGVRWRLECPVH